MKAGHFASLRSLLIVGALLVSLAALARAQTKAPPPTIASVRQQYVGKKAKIHGPVMVPSAGQVGFYINWFHVKRDAHGRYQRESDAEWARLGYGAERWPATIIAVQWSEHQDNGPWVDIFGGHHPGGEFGPSVDFIIRFEDDHGLAMCSSHVGLPSACFESIDSKPAM